MATEETAIRVLVVSDDIELRRALQRSLSSHPAVAAVSSASGLDIAFEVARAVEPHVAIVDETIPGYDPVTAARLLRTAQPRLRVLLRVSALPPAPALRAALEVGCSGVLVMPEPPEVVSAVLAATAGEQVFPAEVQRLLIGELRAGVRTSEYNLTRREVQVLQLLAHGRSTGQMAAELSVTVTTVRNYVQNLLSKMNAHSRLEAVLAGLRDGVVTR